MFRKLLMVFAVAVFSLAFIVKANAQNVSSVINSFNAYYSYTHTSYASNVGSVNLNNYNFSLEGAAPVIPIWGQINYSRDFSSGNIGASFGNGSFNKPSYGAKLGYLININSNLAVIPNIGYEFINTKVNWTENSGFNYSENDHLNQLLLGVKAYYTPAQNFWVEGQAYYMHGEGNKVSGSISSMNMSLTNGSGYELGAKVGYEAYKTSNVILSPFVGINYNHISTDNNLDTVGILLGVKASF
ncbi:MAG: autotransporter outer membrane beta-barrel domain-containing protein [bacterium]